jgi:hypothetical protein
MKTVRLNGSMRITPILASLAVLFTFLPTAAIASDLYIATGKLVDVRAGTVLANQCISITDDQITDLFAYLKTLK